MHAFPLLSQANVCKHDAHIFRAIITHTSECMRIRAIRGRSDPSPSPLRPHPPARMSKKPLFVGVCQGHCVCVRVCVRARCERERDAVPVIARAQILVCERASDSERASEYHWQDVQVFHVRVTVCQCVTHRHGMCVCVLLRA